VEISGKQGASGVSRVQLEACFGFYLLPAKLEAADGFLSAGLVIPRRL